MCSPKTPTYTPEPVQTPVYAQELPPVEEAPELKEKKDTETTAQKAKRRGVRQLRTDLGPQSVNKNTGLNIPV